MDLDAKTIEQLGQRVHDARTFLHVDDKSAELAALDEETAQPGFWDNVSHAQAVSKKAGNLREAIREYDEAVSLFDDAQTAYELAGEDEAFAAEASDACEKLAQLLDSLELSSWFTGEFDDGDAILTVNPGQGGLEANDWADMYKGIRCCDILVDNIERVPDMSRSEKDQWKAEATFLKAFYHFNLIRKWGPVPIIRENTSWGRVMALA